MAQLGTNLGTAPKITAQLGTTVKKLGIQLDTKLGIALRNLAQLGRKLGTTVKNSAQLAKNSTQLQKPRHTLKNSAQLGTKLGTTIKKLYKVGEQLGQVGEQLAQVA